MPVEIKSKDEFIKKSERALECRVVRDEKHGIAKVKARTRKYLYTIKVDLKGLNDFLKSLKCGKIVEFTSKGEKKEISVQ
jgi:hypothetical protein